MSPFRDIERFGWRPTGDIRFFPRKDKLEDVIRRLATSTEAEGVNDIFIHGSWARGEAVPFASDLDIIVEVEPLPSPAKPGQEWSHQFYFTDQNPFVVFNGLDMWVTTTQGHIQELKESFDISPGETVTATGIDPVTEDMVRELVGEEPPYVYYDLINRRQISIS